MSDEPADVAALADAAVSEEFTAAPDGSSVLNGESAPAAGLLATATALAEGNLGSVGSVCGVSARGRFPALDTRLPFGGDDMPPAKPEELEELECVGETSGLNPSGINPVKETGQPFSLLHAAESYRPDSSSRVIVEQDGIHFINNNAFGRNSDKEDLDGDFKKLVETVVGKT